MLSENFHLYVSILCTYSRGSPFIQNRVPPKEDRDIAAGVRKLFSLFRGNSNLILTPACCMYGGVKDFDNYTKIVSVSQSLGAVIFHCERTLWTQSCIVLFLVWFLNVLL